MNARGWSLSALAEPLAIVRLAPDARLPEWADPAPALPIGSGLCSVTRTPAEVSIVCAASRVPATVDAERDWRGLVVAGPLDFSEVGVLASLTAPLAAAGVSVFTLSTFDTDYLLVREAAFDRAVGALRQAGHHLSL